MRTGRGCGVDLVALAFGLVRQVENETPLALAQRKLHGLRQPWTQSFPNDQTVHHELERMLLVLVERRRIVDGAYLPIDAHSGKAPATQLLQQLLLRAFLAIHQRGHDDNAGLFRQFQNILQDLVRGAGLDGAAALRTVDGAKPGEEDAQEVVDLRHCADGGAGIMGGRPLLQRDSGGKPLDLLDVRLVHLRKKLSGIRRKGLHVATLPFGVDKVKS